MGSQPDSAPGAELPFEAALERLEELVERLEAGDLALEDALAAFEEGVALSRRCARQLDVAERRIEVLLEEGGVLGTEAFEAAEEEDEVD
jgi:exodeoxyribonuclease VII small subunit